MLSLTKRQALIDACVADAVASLTSSREFRFVVARDGFTGFSKMGDDALLEAARDAGLDEQHPELFEPDFTGIVKATTWSDDHAVLVDFNAASFFAQAEASDITDLVGCDWERDYPADAVAHHCAEHNPEVAAMFQYISRAPGNLGFECRVNESSVWSWLVAYRPEFALSVFRECISLRLKEEFVAATVMEDVIDQEFLLTYLHRPETTVDKAVYDLAYKKNATGVFSHD